MFGFIRVKFLLIFINLVSKFVFVTKFTCSNLAVKTPSAKCLNSELVI